MSKQEVKVMYKLTDVNLVKKSGVLKAKQEGTHFWIKYNVSISGWLLSGIKAYRKNPNGKARKLEDVVFSSTLMSESYEENPLKLIKFIKDGVESFRVTFVTDKGYYVKRYQTAANTTIEKYGYKHWRKDQFIRYWVVDQDNYNK